jgi:YVTN family beta-propeller protein
MKHNSLFIAIILICATVVKGQQIKPYQYTIKKHSHNDYTRPQPFTNAYNLNFESIEADIFLVNNNLLVAHTIKELDSKQSLEVLYLQPLAQAIKSNGGRVYSNSTKQLQLLIDIKSEAYNTLNALVLLLKKYPTITTNKLVSIVISGNRPKIEDYDKYPNYILFDGQIGTTYEDAVLKRIALMSGDFHSYVKWNGLDAMPLSDADIIRNLVTNIHSINKPIRFWNCPDVPTTWQAMINLQVDYVNTDQPQALTTFIHDLPFSKIQLHDSSTTMMPYNRIIKSAGKVVRYGDATLENHALDIAVLSEKDNDVVVEDRYGIAVINTLTGDIKDRFSYNKTTDLKNLISTYSGIKTFTYNNKKIIVWNVSERNGGNAYLLFAEWDGTIKNVDKIKFTKKTPASNAIPNDIYIANEDNTVYAYIVLNGNNQLVKIKWSDKSMVWQSNTGEAPYGVVKAGNNIYVTNWAGSNVTDTTKESAGTPWGLAYTNPKTGATAQGSVSFFDAKTGNLKKDIQVGLHPSAIIASSNNQYVYVCNGSSDYVSIINTKNNTVIETIATGIFNSVYNKEGSTPNGLTLDAANKKLYVANGLDNAIAVIELRKDKTNKHIGKSAIVGFIPTEAYPAGLVIVNNNLVVANLESAGANVINTQKKARSIHEQLASVSIIPMPNMVQLKQLTLQAYQQNLQTRLASSVLPARKNVLPKPVPERIGEPSVFKHVIYIIKENKTYDQVLGDIPNARGDSSLCIFGKSITPNIHALAQQYGFMDNYYASGKSSAEGHQWTDAGIVSDYVEKNVRAWLRSYPHRQEDALVYNKTGFIWNHAEDNGKSVRIYGEACKTVYNEKLKWEDFYKYYQSNATPNWHNTSTINRIKNMIAPTFPDCDNMVFNDQLRANAFIKEWDEYEKNNNLPNLMILSLPNDHTAGTSPGWPTPNAMVADNDLALGRIIEKISHSKYWDSTVVFVTQDDSQSGWDHISAYRTVGLVISPYSKPQLTTTNYNQTSMLRTIEQILGIPPMHIIDATATPMFDCFSNVKTKSVFKSLPHNIPLNQMNKPMATLKGVERAFALQSLEELFNEIDGGKDDAMNRIIWHYAKGNQKYPAIKK